MVDGYEIWLCDLLHLSSESNKMNGKHRPKRKNRDGYWGMTVRLRVIANSIVTHSRHRFMIMVPCGFPYSVSSLSLPFSLSYFFFNTKSNILSRNANLIYLTQLDKFCTNRIMIDIRNQFQFAQLILTKWYAVSLTRIIYQLFFLLFFFFQFSAIACRNH